MEKMKKDLLNKLKNSLFVIFFVNLVRSKEFQEKQKASEVRRRKIINKGVVSEKIKEQKEIQTSSRKKEIKMVPS